MRDFRSVDWLDAREIPARYIIDVTIVCKLSFAAVVIWAGRLADHVKETAKMPGRFDEALADSRGFLLMRWTV